MDLNLKNWPAQKLQSLTLIVAVILFTSSALWGMFSGASLGADKATFQNVVNLSKALRYFYSDQGRYPTTEEFYTRKILTPYYISALPQPENVKKLCQGYDQYKYLQLSAGDYSLKFCINNSFNGFNQGENEVKPGPI